MCICRCIVWYLVLFFFFSSRRRHTRCSRDWSSDVCSSDLHPAGPHGHAAFLRLQHGGLFWALAGDGRENSEATEDFSCEDRKSTRLNSSHGYISYAVFCLKKKEIEHLISLRQPTDYHI